VGKRGPMSITTGQLGIIATGITNAVVWAYYAGRLVQTVRDIDARVGRLEAQVYKRRRTDFPELVIPRAAVAPKHH
jgi:hypothetical protein